MREFIKYFPVFITSIIIGAFIAFIDVLSILVLVAGKILRIILSWIGGLLCPYIEGKEDRKKFSKDVNSQINKDVNHSCKELIDELYPSKDE